MIAPKLASFLVNRFKPENKSVFRLIKDHNSIRMNDFLINGGIPVTLDSNFLTFRVSNKSFELDEDLLETMKYCHFSISQSNPQDQNLIYKFGKKMQLNVKET